MFLETTPERKIYKELAADHFADPKGLGKYALFLRPSQGDLIPAPQMEPSLRSSPEAGTGPSPLEDATSLPPGTSTPFSSTWRRRALRPPTRVVVIAMNKLRGGHAGDPRVLDNARLTAGGRNLYLIKNKSTNIG
ncbi:MAG: hypothetical protein ACLSCQ_11045 [Evtepia gabavorous]